MPKAAKDADVWVPTPPESILPLKPGEEFTGHNWEQDFKQEIREYVSNMKRYHNSMYRVNKKRRRAYLKRFE